MKFLKAMVATSLIIGITPIAQADTLYGLYADANYWQTDATINGNSRHYGSDGSVMVSARLEHGVPMIPNAHIKYAEFINAGYPEGLTGAGRFDFETTSTDLVAYYEVLDNVVSADMGLGVKVINGTLSESAGSYYAPIGESTGSLDSHRRSSTSSLNQTLPMAYASVGTKLPFTGLSAKAELGVAKGSDAESIDAQAEIKYNFMESTTVDVGAKVGYRIMTLNYNSVDNKKLDTEFKGPYMGMEVHF